MYEMNAIPAIHTLQSIIYNDLIEIVLNQFKISENHELQMKLDHDHINVLRSMNKPEPYEARKPKPSVNA